MFRIDKKVGTVLFLYSKILSCKNDPENDTTRRIFHQTVLPGVECSVGGNLESRQTLVLLARFFNNIHKS
jgi:hypothetical protein